MWTLVIIAIIAAIVVGSYLFLRRAGGGSFPWVQFYLKGKESGFSFKEVNLLRRIAVENRMKEPTSLFWSVKQLDRCIKGMIINFRARGEEAAPEATAIISKLFEFRKRVEFNQPKYNLGIKNSREIIKRQRLKLSLPNIGNFATIVVENMRRYMAVSYPQGGPKLPPGFSFKGQQVGITFWREGDAGYFFQTRVLDDFSQRKYPILHIAHSDGLMRTQKRRSVRADLQTTAQLFPLRSVEDANEEFESSKGLKAYMKDISEDGAAVLIGGRAKVGLPVKFQFTLSDHEIVMCGVVKGVSYDQKKNRSLLHVQALPPSARTKNTIRSYVYNIFGERAEGAPAKQTVKN
jgi:c-di-GMP-binding flagellar brake protein YcgR